MSDDATNETVGFLLKLPIKLDGSEGNRLGPTFNVAADVRAVKGIRADDFRVTNNGAQLDV